MALPSESFKNRQGYFHASGKVNTEANQYTFESPYKSSHNILSKEVWTDVITYSIDAAAADTFTTANPTIVTKYTQQLLTMVPGSNGQAWYIDNAGTFVRPWIAPTDVPNATTNLPSFGFEVKLFKNDLTPISPTEGIWTVDYYAGIIKFQEGYTPTDLGYGVPRATVYAYIGQTLADGGGGSGTFEVMDEGVSIGTTFTKLNFIGVDVMAIPGDPTTANIYVPTPDFASHLNTLDGSTTGTVTPLTTTARFLSAPSPEGTPFFIGTAWASPWAAGESRPTIRAAAAVNFAPGGAIRFDSEATTITVTVYGGATGAAIATHATGAITAAGMSATVNNITITVSAFTPNANAFRANLSVGVNIAAILPNGGRFRVVIQHVTGGNTYTFTQTDVFRDAEPSTIEISGIAIDESAGDVVTNHVSGVEYYGTGSLFNVNVGSVDFANYNSYPATALNIAGPEYGLTAANIAHATLTDWTNAYDNAGAYLSDYPMGITAVQFMSVDATANITATGYDWAADDVQVSANAPVCINTYTNNATRVYEDFRLENRRLQSDLSTPWVSLDSLATADGGTGLQVGGRISGAVTGYSRLIYPQFNYSTYQPDEGGANPNYSALVGTKFFYIDFNHPSVSHSNGIFRILDHNITEAKLTANDIKIEISLDGVAWFNLNADYPGGEISNGQGCRINKDQHGLAGATVNDNQLEFTFGNNKFTDAASGLAGWGVFVRISYADTVNGRASYMGSFEITNWV